MPRIFPVIVKRTTVIDSGGEVTVERLTYELPEVHPLAESLESAGPSVLEVHPDPIDEGAAGILAAMEETHPVPDVAVTIGAVVEEVQPDPTSLESAGPSVLELHPVPLDETILVAAVLNEEHPVPEETIVATFRQQVDEIHDDPSELVVIGAAVAEAHDGPSELLTLALAVSEVHDVPVEEIVLGTSVSEVHADASELIGIGASVYETHDDPVEVLLIGASVLEIHPEATEEFSATFRVIIDESHPDPVDAITLVGVVDSEVHPDPSDSIPINLKILLGVTTVTEEETGGPGWTNDNNFAGMNGAGGNATLVGQVTQTNVGRLVGQFRNFTDDISTYTITKVELRFYVSVSGTVANNGDMRLSHRQGTGTWTLLETFTGDVSPITTPQVYDITAHFGTWNWTRINDLACGVRGQAAVGELFTISADACLLYIEATKTY